jgi:hypothetical protein
MPYLECPSCRLSTFSAARPAAHADCPRCGAELSSRPRRLFRPLTARNEESVAPDRGIDSQTVDRVKQLLHTRRPVNGS